jgi:hypothetical protein
VQGEKQEDQQPFLHLDLSMLGIQHVPVNRQEVGRKAQ